MNIKNRIKAWLLTACSIAVVALSVGSYCTPAYAADDQNTDKKDKNEIDYTLDKEVKEWLDEGNSIPAEAKYSTLSSTSHLWALDDTDISDGKVELIGNNESRILAGVALRDWLKTQSFYGEKLGEPDNKIKFKRPKKPNAF